MKIADRFFKEVTTSEASRGKDTFQKNNSKNENKKLSGRKRECDP
jgi:hypothetical protein